MKKIIFLFMIISLSWAITYTPANPKVGDTVTFSLTHPDYFSYSYCSVRWNFGDGSPTITIDNPYASVQHVYTEAGNYTVVADPVNCLTTSPGPEYAIITVSSNIPNISIQVSYSLRPWPGYPVHFTLLNAPSGTTATWDFGDGTVISGGTSVSHSYTNPGTYNIRATVILPGTRRPTATQITVTAVVVIQQDPRQLSWLPQLPNSGQPVEFRAINFLSSKILWDFGDGTIKLGPPVIKHIFRRHGIFTVKATDMGGDDIKQFTYMVTVKPGKGAFIGLVIHSIELLFENNNKSYIVVPFRYTNLKAKAKIRYEGSGVLAGFWTVDDIPFASFNKTLNFRGTTELKVSGLPAINPSLHTVSLRITQPQLYPELDVTIPVIRYYVSAIENKIEIITPKNGDIFFAGEKVQLSWKSIPQVFNYTLAYGESPEEVLAGKGKELSLNLQGRQDLEFPPGKYFIRVIGENQDGLPMYFSDLVNFEIVETPIRIKVGAFKDVEEETVTREKLKRGKYYNLAVDVNILKGGPYLIRTFFNGKMTNEEWIPEGEKFYTTTVLAENGLLEVRVYRVFKGKLRLVVYKTIKIVVE